MLTIGELRKLIRGVPNNVKVVLGIDESLEDICPGSCKIVMIEYNDTGGKEPLLILPICTCKLTADDEMPDGEINSQPELN